MYSLKIHKKASAFLKSQNQIYRKAIKEKLELLIENPFNNSHLDIKKLKNVKNTYRLRIGNIRIIYQVIRKDLLILIISAGKRDDIYKKTK